MQKCKITSNIELEEVKLVEITNNYTKVKDESQCYVTLRWIVTQRLKNGLIECSPLSLNFNDVVATDLKAWNTACTFYVTDVFTRLTNAAFTKDKSYRQFWQSDVNVDWRKYRYSKEILMR